MIKRLWPDLRYYFGICLEGLMETTTNLGNIVHLWSKILTRSPQVRTSAIFATVISLQSADNCLGCATIPEAH
jgi:hypothetical protein